MKKTIALAMVLTLLAGPAAADHSWGNYHWARTANPVSLKVNMALTGNWPQYVGPAVTQWDQSPALALVSPATVSTNTKKCDPIAGQVLVCNALYGQRGWLGIASIWTNGDHITQATTKLNDTYFNTARYNTHAWRAMVACQEIGHDFGLGHVNETFTDPNTGSCMDYTNDPSGTAGPTEPRPTPRPTSTTTISWRPSTATPTGRPRRRASPRPTSASGHRDGRSSSRFRARA